MIGIAFAICSRARFTYREFLNQVVSHTKGMALRICSSQSKDCGASAGGSDGISRKGIGFTRCCGWENCISLTASIAVTASNFRCPVSVETHSAIFNTCYI